MHVLSAMLNANPLANRARGGRQGHRIVASDRSMLAETYPANSRSFIDDHFNAGAIGDLLDFYEVRMPWYDTCNIFSPFEGRMNESGDPLLYYPSPESAHVEMWLQHMGLRNEYPPVPTANETYWYNVTAYQWLVTDRFFFVKSTVIMRDFFAHHCKGLRIRWKMGVGRGLEEECVFHMFEGKHLSRTNPCVDWVSNYPDKSIGNFCVERPYHYDCSGFTALPNRITGIYNHT
mmetsp:Transcript_8475/g.21077  ORF Transcript_8475/g.21077 Transcript_8475/m.21077 type:complete len:233 (-) Transcript_8475:350-1048(-)